MVSRALLAVAGYDVPVVATSAFNALAGLVVAFGLAGVFADLAVELYHEFTFFDSDGKRGFGEAVTPFL